MSRQLTRRHAIKSFVLGAAFSNAIGQAWAVPVLHELKALSHLQGGALKIQLADFPALAQPLGSVRISTSPLDARGQRQLGLFPPVIINRAADGALHVLSAACTHEDCTVRRVNPTSQKMVCPCHGSQYGVDGTVLQGPAGQSLQRYNFQERGEALEIELPDVFYEVTARKTDSSSRVALSFLAFENLVYEVHFRESVTGPAARIPFATSLAGPLDRTEFPGNADLPVIYVERPGKAGIFQIVMKTQEV